MEYMAEDNSREEVQPGQPGKASDEAEQGKHPGGRPLKFKTPDELTAAIEAYFAKCDPHVVERMVETGVDQNGQTILMLRKVMTEQQPYTMSGLARTIGLSRQGLLN